MTNDEKADGLDAIIEDLIEWELEDMDYKALQEFFYNNMRDFYQDNPNTLQLMLEYRKQYEDTEIVLEVDQE